jgi:hypothetical protein
MGQDSATPIGAGVAGGVDALLFGGEAAVLADVAGLTLPAT